MYIIGEQLSVFFPLTDGVTAVHDVVRTQTRMFRAQIQTAISLTEYLAFYVGYDIFLSVFSRSII